MFKVFLIKRLTYNISLRVQEKNDFKIFHASAELIPIGSDIDEAFKSMHQSIMIKIKSSARENWIVVKTFVKHSITVFES